MGWVTAIQSAREKLILCANKHPWLKNFYRAAIGSIWSVAFWKVVGLCVT